MSEYFWRGLVYVGVQSALVRFIAERRVAAAVIASGLLSTIWLANAGRAKSTSRWQCLAYGCGAAVATGCVLMW